MAYAELLELALALHLLGGKPGMAPLQRDLVRHLEPERLVHTQLQLEVARLALRHTEAITLEAALQRDGAPVDVVFDLGSGSLAVETVALTRDKGSRMLVSYSDWLLDELFQIQIRYRVHISGSIRERLHDTATTELLERVESAAQFAARGGVPVPIRVGAASLSVSDRMTAGDRLTGPQIRSESGRRLAGRVRRKADQAAKSGANWLRLTAVDGLFGFSAWAREPLEPKALRLASFLQSEIELDGPLSGVVVSSGAGLAPGPVEELTLQLPQSITALRRRIVPVRAREIFIVPLNTERHVAAPEWITLYGDEAAWLAWALEAAGLALPEELSDSLSR